MPRVTRDVPRYRKHRASGQAIVTLSSQDVYLGPHGTKVSRLEYDRQVAEWLARGRRPDDADDGQAAMITVVELIAAYKRFAESYYRKNGEITNEVTAILSAAAIVKRLYAREPASAFGPLKLQAVQQAMILAGWSRKHFNKQLGRVVRMFGWGGSQELVSANVAQALREVKGLHKGRTQARETAPVMPVEDSVVKRHLGALAGHRGRHGAIPAAHRLSPRGGLSDPAVRRGPVRPGLGLPPRITQDRAPWPRACDLHRPQGSRGLEAAHQQGVIHRDLKPANIKITDEGKVRVLDFGLAKAAEIQRTATNDGVTSPWDDHSAGKSRLGQIVGTPAYMSPEQARGKAVDKRTDIWAFGCCLYEALTGQRSFRGETVSDTLAMILAAEPDWKELPESTPPRLRELLERCLAKDLRSRLRDIGDAGLELAQIASNPGMASTAAAVPAGSLVVGRRRLVATMLFALMIGSLATGIEDKDLILHGTGAHELDWERAQKETLIWFDKYLGKVPLRAPRPVRSS
jgi:hypothetical protein